jgi:transcriptional regulator with XRE-family HTH domain
MNIKNTGHAQAKLEKMSGIKLTFGNMLWSIRKCEDITQTEFAKLLGISSQHLCDIEHGRKIVSPQLAAKYAQILGENQEQFIRLAIQSALDKAGLNYDVFLKAA